MMRSLYSGVAGLKTHQTGMDVVGNNIANVNTTGFKSFRATYQDTLYQTSAGASQAQNNRGGTNPIQVGLGVGNASIDKMFKDGSIQATSSKTDLCLSGDGLFIVKDGSGEYYTRNGAFRFDGQGNYVNSAGQFVMGWMGAGGEVNTNAQPGIINIPAGKPMAAKETNMAIYSNNLDAAESMVTNTSGGNIKSTALNATSDYPVIVTMSDKNTFTLTSGNVPLSATLTGGSLTGGIAGTAPGTIVATEAVPVQVTIGGQTFEATSGTFVTADYAAGGTVTVSGIGGGKDTIVEATAENPLTLTMSNGKKVTVTSGVYRTNYSLPLATTITIYDKLGNDYAVPVMMSKHGPTGNTWSVYLEGNDPGGDGIGGTLTLYEKDKDGKDTIPAIELKMNQEEITLEFNADGSYKSGEGNITFTPLGRGEADAGNVAIDLSNLTQYAGSNTVKGTTDGYAAGNLAEINIDSSGVITGTYTNGIIQQEGVVAVAQFNNSGGLTSVGSSLYQKSNNSGEPNIKTATDMGCTITPSALEMSNVDIANEFSTMIVTQRGFQSNSKIITVSDEMLETLIQLKR